MRRNEKPEFGDFDATDMNQVATPGWMMRNRRTRTQRELEVPAADFRVTGSGQGMLGDCWFLAAIATVACHDRATRQSLLDTVMPRQWYKGDGQVSMSGMRSSALAPPRLMCMAHRVSVHGRRCTLSVFPRLLKVCALKAHDFFRGIRGSHSERLWAGAYVVRFFKNGRWTSVVVDDRVPVRRSSQSPPPPVLRSQ
jgi:hypothetical protein